MTIYPPDVASYDFVPPRHELPEQTAASLREQVARQPDMTAVWWLTALLHDDDGREVVREELHFELETPPDDETPEGGALLRKLYRDLTHAGVPPAGISFCISPLRILPAVRAVGTRID